MSLTLTATAKPSHSPPRILLTVTESDSMVGLNAVRLFRDGQELRFAAQLTGLSAVVYDYDAPFGVELSYRADADETSSAVLWSETWANVSSWTASGGTGWSASGGLAVNTTTDASIYRAAVANRFTVGASTDAQVELRDATNTIPLVTATVSNGRVKLVGSTTQEVTGSGAFDLILGTGTVSVVGTGWSAQVAFTGSPAFIWLRRAPLSKTREWSTSGTPDCICRDSSGNLYITDGTNKLVRKYDSTGTFLASWTTTHSPNGIAVDSSGNTYVTTNESGTYLLRKFNSSGTQTASWSTVGVSYGVEVDGSGNVYTTDATNKLVRKFNSSGTQTLSFSTTGSPDGIALDSTGKIVITDGDNKMVRRFTTAGVADASWALTGAPNEVAVDQSSGDVWVTNKQNSSIDIYTSAGVLINSYSMAGQPSDVALVPLGGVADEDFYVVNAGSAKVEQFHRPNDVSVDDITAYQPTFGYTVSASDAETLSVDQAWLTNAVDPDLALPLGPGEDHFIVDSTRVQGSLDSTTVALPIEGSADVLTVSTGPRGLETWTLDVACLSEDARRDMKALLANSSILSLRLPAGEYDGLDDGFYAVGDVALNRVGHPSLEHAHIATLPLTPSRAPAFDAVWSWNWDALASTGLTWDEVAALYPTWNDLLVGPTS